MKQNLFRSVMANAMTALLCASVWHGPAQAAEPTKKRDMFYYGEREFCLSLLNNADQAEKIEPVVGPTHITDIDEGEHYAPKLRLYIVQSPMPIPVIYKLIKQRQWMTLLGYTPWKANSSAGRMVTDPRWRKYDDQCPGIFRYHDYRDPDKIVGTPTEMTLFELGANSAGRLNTIYRNSDENDSTYYDAADFKSCTLKQVLWIRAASDLFWFKNNSYVITNSALLGRRGGQRVTIYRISSLTQEIDRNGDTCHFSGIDRFTDYLRDKHLFNKPKYRR